ncbi:cytochrome P450 [Kitasatospora sp. NPDC056651]|uniref:cytochrome P450 n=1 Tax=Kitasatospora sp. NPDC056651 TaxID=3345892 RepID=UPI0036CCD476
MSAPAPFPFPECPGIAPAPEYDGLAERGRLVPVTLRSGATALLVHRHEDVCRVLTDPAFSRAAAARFGLTARSPESLALNAADAPDHTRRRQVVAPAFTHRRIARLRPEIERLTEDLLDRMAERGAPADLLADFAVPLTVEVGARLFGLSAEQVTRLLPLVERMMSTTAYGRSEVESAHHAMFAEFERHLADRDPAAEDLLGPIAGAVRDGRLGANEAVHLAYGLLIASHETTVNQLGACALLLLRDPELAHTLRTEPELLPDAVTEMLRFSSLNATGGVPHVVTEPVRLAGTDLAPGTVVLPATDGANRDPDVFARPHELRLDRTDNPHVSFGKGRHRCLGAPLAQMELEVALGALLRRLPTLRAALPEEELRWRTGMYVRGVRELPITW